MKKRLALSAAAVLFLPALLSAQYSNFVGTIDTYPNPLAIATDGTALYYATFDQDNSSNAGIVAAYKISDPGTAIGVTADQGTTITATTPGTPFANGRGFQGIQVDSSGNIYISGDTGSSTAYVKKFNSSFVEDTTFGTNSEISARVSGIALVGDGVLAGQLFGGIEYFNTADGTQTGLTTPITGMPNYHREAVFNSADNVIYGLRNGGSSAEMVSGYISGVSTSTGGGTYNSSSLIATGASDTAFGTATQHGYYDATSGKLVTLDQKSPGTDSEIRFWDITASGATLTEDTALKITATNTTPASNWTGVSDAVIVGNRIYVTSVNDDAIYVFEESAGMDDWSLHN